ncbi:hypothetical protein ACRE_056240 [Hapsidospora chrysogenum ATCC 11550]|uniref:Uncharacterized protein n=1 Tax=Hapsidospora chrysogenum (strain ATCC 11550 / CBS 779.69 / DSM 880 / IAM 14645 / JCM 23072 / IMI 49137) TaxID=857340 RepID=A0A086T2L7_HAPC1|nr:hypothetical protein ACRE_056240 [Hapsidospora chrysogenum ATCC 11550]
MGPGDTLAVRAGSTHTDDNDFVAWFTSWAVDKGIPQKPKPAETTTLWPPFETTTAAEGESDDEESSRPGPETTATESDSAETTLVTELSTITGDGMTTRTDSGKTVTVPNDEIVTVTRHTVIITGKPAPSLTSAAPEPTPIPSRPNQDGPAQTTLGQPDQSQGAGDPSGDHQEGAALPTGAIVGVGIGGAVIVAFLVIMTIMIKRRRKRYQDGENADVPGENLERDDRFDEKHFPQQMSVHTTGGTEGSGDPFAPFGGRADREPESTNRPPSDAFEMDATSITPVELPDTSPGTTIARTTSSATWVSPVTDIGPADPRANLNSLGCRDGKPEYVNHWNQYRSMSSG